jgi:hypothetical protein
MIKIFIVLLSLIHTCLFCQNSGFIKNEFKDKMSYRVKVDESSLKSTTRGNDNSLVSYSLEQFLPEIGNQGQTPSCVGWSSTYYALTIAKRIEMGKNYPAFSPWSSFNRYQTRKFKSTCENGCWIEEVLLILQNEGSPTYEDYEIKHCAFDSSRRIYKDKLLSWNRISNSRDQIKSALLFNYPVVIGISIMQSYDGMMLGSKYINENGILNLNTFENSQLGGGHAMCIVGFNDTLEGGAFKIVNSWGKEWGKNGFCWLKYSDLKYISNAFFLQSKTDQNRSEKERFITNSLNFINSSDSSIFIALANKNNNNQLYSRGWFEILPGQKRNLNISDRNNNDIYWMAIDSKGNQIKPSNKTDCINFYVDILNAFEFTENESKEKLNQVRFIRYSPVNKNTIEDVILELNNNTGIVEISNVFLNESRDLVNININWDGKTPLLDPLTHEIVIRDPKTKGNYSVFIWDNGKAKEIKGKINKLTKIKNLKFLNSKNASEYNQKS